MVWSTSNTLYVQNSYLVGFKTLAHFERSQHTVVPPTTSAWTHVQRYVHGEPPLVGVSDVVHERVW